MNGGKLGVGLLCEKVLVLHPNDEQKVIKLQEEISVAFRKRQSESGEMNGVKIFNHFPLWCELEGIGNGSDSFGGLDNKGIAKLISSVNVFSPEFLFDGNLHFNDTTLFNMRYGNCPCVFLPVDISFESGTKIKSSLVLSVFSDIIAKNPVIELPEFSLNPKIFRIGDATFSGNQYYITDSTWRKLKK